MTGGNPKPEDGAAGPPIGTCRFCWKRALAGLPSRLSRRGFRLSALPGSLWLALFYAFVVHVRLSLGGWPPFGQPLEGTLLGWHEAAVWQLGRGLFLSLYAAPVAMVVLLFLPRWRHGIAYVLTHAVAVVAAYGLVFLAPGPFLNWFFD